MTDTTLGVVELDCWVCHTTVNVPLIIGDVETTTAGLCLPLRIDHQFIADHFANHGDDQPDAA